MIAVDSSVWIDHLNDVTTAEVALLRDTMLIGTFCIDRALPLLHSDRDFILA